VENELNTMEQLSSSEDDDTSDSDSEKCPITGPLFTFNQHEQEKFSGKLQKALEGVPEDRIKNIIQSLDSRPNDQKSIKDDEFIDPSEK
jgi:hypothetical protein